jgi:hypothetical protein
VKIQPMYRMKIFSKHVSHKAFLRWVISIPNSEGTQTIGRNQII